jgi:hypothetical protein
MKSVLNLSVVALVLSATTAQAQFYIGAQGGYNIGTAITALGTTNSLKDTTQTNIYGSRGGGMNFGLNAGFLINDYLGIDLGASYFINGEVMTGYSETKAANGTVTKTTTLQSGSQIRVVPSIVVMSGRGAGFGVYGRFGALLPIGGESVANVNSEIITSAGTFTDKRTYKSKGQASIGFNTAIGARYGINEHLDLFLEANLTTLNVRGASADLVALETTVPGAKTLDKMNVYETQTVFVDALNNTSNNAAFNGNFRTDMPREDLVKTVNYSAIGGNLGLKYKF